MRAPWLTVKVCGKKFGDTLHVRDILLSESLSQSGQPQARLISSAGAPFHQSQYEMFQRSNVPSRAGTRI